MNRARETTLLVVAGDRTETARFSALPSLAEPGEVWIVNDAATFPASLAGVTEAGEPLELRLLPYRGAGRWAGVLFGQGNWRMRTEDRPPPPELPAGEILRFGPSLRARVFPHAIRSKRLFDCEFDGPIPEVWRRIYEWGKPIQYAHHSAPLELWSVQTPFAARPWASEMPSAGRPFTWEILRALRARGAAVHFLTHRRTLTFVGETF